MTVLRIFFLCHWKKAAAPIGVACALLFFDAFAAVAPATAQASDAVPATQQVTAERMTRAGLTRIDDLFWLLDGWETASLDGYTVRPSAIGMPEPPLLVIGGRPVMGGPFGRPPLPILPVHLLQVRSVNAVRAPQLVAGHLAPNGAVRLPLRTPAPGVTAQGAFSAGNEVGDPGPFRATERRVTNVDRIGPQYFTETSVWDQGASARLSLRAVRHYTTDRAIRARVENANDTLDGPPLQQLIAPRLALADGDLLPGAHRLTAHYAMLRSLPLFRTLGYEVPARRRNARLGVQGAFPSDSDRRPRLQYRLGYRRATLTPAPGRFRESLSSTARAFGGAENHFSGQLELGELSLGTEEREVGLRLGLSADYTRARANAAPLDDPGVLTTRAYTEIAARALSGIRPRLALLLSQTDGQLGGGAVLSSRCSARPSHEAGYTLRLHLAYVRRPYAAGGSFWYWLQQGFPAPLAADGEVTLPASFPASERLTADVRLRRAFAGGSHLTLELGARHLQHLTLPDADYGFARVPFRNAPLGGRLVPHIRLRPDAAGQTFHAAVEGVHTFPAGLTHRLRYDFFTYRAAGSGGRRRAFEQRFRRTPRHRVRYSARLDMEDRFSLEGRLTARSPERWPAYRRAARAEGSLYRHRLPSRLRVDLTATKRLWHDHLRLRLALRNLLDAPLRTHPAGPVRRLTLFVSAEARF